MGEQGTVSVIVLCYNYGRFLRECINSVNAQTRKPMEILIMDDCSTDDTEKVAHTFLKRKKIPVHYHRADKNMGTPAMCNRGLALARGQYVMMLGADNILHPEYVEKTAHELDVGIKGLGIVYTNTYAFGSKAKGRSKGMAWYTGEKEKHDKLGMLYLWAYPSFGQYNDYPKYRKRLEHGNFIHGSALYRRQIFLNGLMYQNVDKYEDFYFWKAAVGRGWHIKHVPEALLFYRQHSGEQRNVKGKPPA